MNKKTKIVCGSFSVLLFLFFGFLNHALAYSIDLRPDCSNPILESCDPGVGANECFQVFCNGDYYKTIGTVDGGGATVFYSLLSHTPVSYYVCTADGINGDLCSTTNEYTDTNKSLEGFQLTEEAFINGQDPADQSYFEFANNGISIQDLFNGFSVFSEATSTGATGMLDGIMSQILATTILFVTIVFTDYWPYILVVAIISGFIIAFSGFFKKIIK
jgi:hypothetical protein